MVKSKLVVRATIEETFSYFIISKKTKGVAEKTPQSYQSQFQAVARQLDVNRVIAMLQKADLDTMIISMRDASLSPNSINSYTRTLKSFFSFALILQIIWVMVPMGQKLHQVLGFHRVFTTSPMMVEASIRL